MNIKSFKTSDLLKPKMLAPALFAGIGGAKIYKDYQHTKPEKKKIFITKDIAILFSSALGYFASMAVLKRTPGFKVVDKTIKAISRVFEKLSKTGFIKNNITPKLSRFREPLHKTGSAVKSSLNHIENAVKDCLSAGFITLGSIGAALGANELVSRYIFKKQKKSKEPELSQKSSGADAPPPIKNNGENKKENGLSASEKGAGEVFEGFKQTSKSLDYLQYINTEFSKDPANKVFASFSFLPVMRALDFPMTAAAGFDITKIEDSKERIKKTSCSLIANIFVPTFLLSIVSALTKQYKNKVKVPVLAFTTLVGIALGTAAGRAWEQKINAKLDLK